MKKVVMFFIFICMPVYAPAVIVYANFSEVCSFVCKRLKNISVVYEKKCNNIGPSGSDADISDNEYKKTKRITFKKQDKKN